MKYQYKKWGSMALALGVGLTAFWTQAQTITKASWIQSIENQRIYFDTGQTTLNGQTRQQLNEVAGRLNQLYGDFAIEVTGHTDNEGEADLNLKISQLRALTVVDYLSRNNAYHHAFLVQAKGEYAPLASNETQEGRSLNRRVELKIIAENMDAISMLGGTQPQEDLAGEQWAQMTETPEAMDSEETSDASMSDEMWIEEEMLDELSPEPTSTTEMQAEPSSLEEEEVEMDEEKNMEEPAAATAASAPSKQAPPTHSEGDYSITGAKAKGDRKYKSSDYYISSGNNEPVDGPVPHVYDRRKKPVKGTLEVALGPEWVRLNDLDDAGATATTETSKPSFLAQLQWKSLLEDNENIFVGLGGFARWTQFDQANDAGFNQEQEAWTFGGHALLGLYMTPNVSLALQGGYESYLYLAQAGGNLRLDQDYVVVLGPALEAVVWRFHRLGDVGLAVRGGYMDFGQGDIESGWQYGGQVFMDYRLFRLSFEWAQIDLDTSSVDTAYQRWALKASLFY